MLGLQARWKQIPAGTAAAPLKSSLKRLSGSHIFHDSNVRFFHSSLKVLNEQKGQSKEEPELTTRGVKDPGTERHGYDPLKPRKPLSRISIGNSYDPQAAERQRTIGFFNWKVLVLFFGTGGALLWYLKAERKRIQLRREEESNRGYGKPLIGGPFELIDENGNKFTDKDLLGHFSLIYFGFSMCPDICPDELDKMAELLNAINKPGTPDKDKILPVFITCDPARDPPEVLKAYLSEFHPDIKGLTGSYEDIKRVCKLYRVYFSTPPDVKPGQDYLVDHSIFFYLMDPEGKFIDVLGRNYTSEQRIERVKEHMANWQPEKEREKKKNGWISWIFT